MHLSMPWPGRLTKEQLAEIEKAKDGARSGIPSNQSHQSQYNSRSRLRLRSRV